MDERIAQEQQISHCSSLVSMKAQSCLGPINLWTYKSPQYTLKYSFTLASQ